MRRWLVTVCLGAALGAAVSAAGETAAQAHARNSARLQQLNTEQRRQVWEKYQTFLSLPPAEQERIRRLNDDLRKLPNEKRERYLRLMERYKKWKDELPLYQRQMLEDAAPQGSAKLYEVFRDVRDRRQEEERLRQYWLLPEPRLRAFVHTVLRELSREEIEALDQLPPRDRLQDLFAYAEQRGVALPQFARADRIGGRRPLASGPLPPVEWKKLEEFFKSLPREQKEELGDPGRGRPAQLRRLLQRYYAEHPEELAERRKRASQAAATGSGEPTAPSDPPADSASRQAAPQSQPTTDSPSPDRSKPPGKLGIRPKNP